MPVLAAAVVSVSAKSQDLAEYVNPLMGTDSKPSLSNGNTYPAIALPWGMNLWTPQTGKMGDGWFPWYPWFNEEKMHTDLATIHEHAKAAGRSPADIGIEGAMYFDDPRFPERVATGDVHLG